MNKFITQDELDSIIENSWKELCVFAYNSYLENGKGFIGIDKREETGEYQIFYATIGENSSFDDKIVKVVNEYQPDYEIVLHFASDENQYRTIRINHPSKPTPEELWVRENFIKN